MPNYFKKTILILAILLICVAVLGKHGEKSFASTSVGDYTPLAPITASNLKPPTDLSSYLQNLFLIGIGISGAMAVFMIVLGGVQYMSTDAFTGKTDGKKRIWNALEGLALVLLCWLIMYTINPTLVSLNFNPGSSAKTTSK